MPDMSELFYPYKDAEGKGRKGDPLELRRRLWAYCNGGLDELLKQCDSQLPEISIPANERVAAAACKAFRLGEPYSETTGEGVLESVWRTAMDGLSEYFEKNEPAAEGEPNLSQPSASESLPSLPSSSCSSTSTST